MIVGHEFDNVTNNAMPKLSEKLLHFKKRNIPVFLPYYIMSLFFNPKIL